MTESHAKQKGARPVWIAIAIAIFGVLAMLIVDHGPWSRTHVQTAQIASHHRPLAKPRVPQAPPWNQPRQGPRWNRKRPDPSPRSPPIRIRADEVPAVA